MNEEIVKQTTKQQIKAAFKDMGTRSYSMAKNFSYVGMIYSTSECCIESVSRYINMHGERERENKVKLTSLSLYHKN
jgi:hypothetical protein